MPKEMLHRESVGPLGRSVELDLDPQRFVTAVELGFQTPLDIRPSISQSWHPKTDQLLTSRWSSLSPTHRRIASVLVEIGRLYPDCASIESMTRLTIQSKDTTVEQLADYFGRFQDRARRMGNPMILERASAMASLALVIPDIHLKTGSDVDVMTSLIKLMPVVIFASLESKEVREENRARRKAEKQKRMDQDVARKRARNSDAGSRRNRSHPGQGITDDQNPYNDPRW